MRIRPLVTTALLGWSVLLPAPARALVPAPTATARPRGLSPAPPHLGRGDVGFLAVSAAAVAWAARNDRWLTDETVEGHSPGEHRLAAWAQPLGNVGVVLPALGLSYEAARLGRHAGAAQATLRIGAAVGVAGGVTLALKEAVGRARPYESPGDAASFHPFSGHASFPSGHATIAFAVASALDRETSSRWVPWLAYPAASLLGWSRVHDRDHWTSDVVAGAAIGAWTARKTDDWLRARATGATHARLELVPGPRSARLTLRF